MKAVAVIPGKANSIHLREVAKPMLNGAAQDVLVKVLRVGIDGTDKEINAAEYGAPPPGDEFLILGHESFGVVESVGPKVSGFEPGDYVVASVRRPGTAMVRPSAANVPLSGHAKTGAGNCSSMPLLHQVLVFSGLARPRASCTPVPCGSTLRRVPSWITGATGVRLGSTAMGRTIGAA